MVCDCVGIEGGFTMMLVDSWETTEIEKVKVGFDISGFICVDVMWWMFDIICF